MDAHKTEYVTHPIVGSIPWGFKDPKCEAKAAKAAKIENPDTANREPEKDETPTA